MVGLSLTQQVYDSMQSPSLDLATKNVKPNATLTIDFIKLIAQTIVLWHMQLN